MYRSSCEYIERGNLHLKESKDVIYRSSQGLIRGRLWLLDMFMTRISVLYDYLSMVSLRLSFIELVSL